MLKLKDPELFGEAALVGSRWVEAEGNDSLTVINPATGEVMGYVPRLDKAEALEAITELKYLCIGGID